VRRGETAKDDQGGTIFLGGTTMAKTHKGGVVCKEAGRLRKKKGHQPQNWGEREKGERLQPKGNPGRSMGTTETLGMGGRKMKIDELSYL